jgi:c-di-GMP-binding flagellar brake protein YcgR
MSLPGRPSLSGLLKVGQPLQLTLVHGDGTNQCGSTLLGWKDGAWLICEWPFQLGQAVACENGARCVVKYFAEGKLVGYQTEIRDRQSVPIPLLYLGFPKQIEEIPLRRHIRVPASEPLLLIQADQAQTNGMPQPITGALLTDLSVAGCRIILCAMSGSFVPGAKLRLEFELIGLGHVTNLLGVVKNVAVDGSTTSLGVQFQFDNMEYIEFRGWGGTVQRAIEHCVLQKQTGS